MARIYGLFGSMTGKLADVVMGVRYGEQYARKYQPIVFNPSTPAQIAQRAKMKLLSQLSAVMAPAIAIPREGSMSARNIFTKLNYPSVVYADSNASVDVRQVKLTKSVVGMPAVVAAVNEGNISCGIEGGSSLDVNRVVYVQVVKGADESLRFVNSAVGSNPSNSFGASLVKAIGTSYVLAYGVRDNTEAARVTFGNLTSPTAQDIAKLIVTRVLTESDITVTETVGVKVQTQA